MKIQHFQEQIKPNIRRPHLVITLRYEKIKINRLLRSCSAGLLCAYIMVIVSGIHFYNQVISSSAWLPELILLLFGTLFACLLYIQYLYSEKRINGTTIARSAFLLNSFYTLDYYQAGKRLTGIYLIATAATAILSACIFPVYPHFDFVFLIVSGLGLYLSGMIMIRRLLKEKFIMRLIIKNLPANK